MLRRFGIALLCAIGGYLLGAFGGGLLVTLLASARPDRSVEAAMTGAFVFGPLVAVIAFVAGFVKSAPVKPPAA